MRLRPEPDMSPATSPRLPRAGNPLLPVLASQGLAAALMLGGGLDFLDWQLLVLVEAWLVNLTLLAYAERGSPQASFANFLLVSLVVLPVLWLFIALVATLMLYPDDARAPWSIVIDAAGRLATGRWRAALLFVLAGLAVSLVQVQGALEKAAWWRERVLAQYQVNLVATLASLFAMGPLLILRNELDAVREWSAGRVDLALLALLAALRLLIAVQVAKPAGASRR